MKPKVIGIRICEDPNDWYGAQKWVVVRDGRYACREPFDSWDEALRHALLEAN